VPWSPGGGGRIDPPHAIGSIPPPRPTGSGDAALLGGAVALGNRPQGVTFAPQLAHALDGRLLVRVLDQLAAVAQPIAERCAATEVAAAAALILLDILGRRMPPPLGVLDRIVQPATLVRCLEPPHHAPALRKARRSIHSIIRPDRSRVVGFAAGKQPVTATANAVL
jgi:hypothetical protein